MNDLRQICAELDTTIMEVRFIHDNGYDVPEVLWQEVCDLLLAKGYRLGVEPPSDGVAGTFVNIAALGERFGGDAAPPPRKSVGSDHHPMPLAMG